MSCPLTYSVTLHSVTLHCVTRHSVTLHTFSGIRALLSRKRRIPKGQGDPLYIIAIYTSITITICFNIYLFISLCNFIPINSFFLFSSFFNFDLFCFVCIYY